MIFSSCSFRASQIKFNRLNALFVVSALEKRTHGTWYLHNSRPSNCGSACWYPKFTTTDESLASLEMFFTQLASSFL